MQLLNVSKTYLREERSQVRCRKEKDDHLSKLWRLKKQSIYIYQNIYKVAHQVVFIMIVTHFCNS